MQEAAPGRFYGVGFINWWDLAGARRTIAEQVDRIGIDRIMWSSGYPHSESIFGLSKNAVRAVIDAVGPSTAPAVPGGTVKRFLGLS